MRKFGLLLTALLVLTPSSVRATPNADHLTALVRQALATASDNFGTLHAGVLRTDADDVVYRPSPAAFTLCAKLCASGGVIDEFANGKHDERWVAQFQWTVDKSWTDKEMVAYIRSTIGPLVPTATFSHGVDNDDGTSWLQWDTGKTQFVYVETVALAKTGPQSFIVRVGRNSPSNVHVVRLSRGLTSADRDELTKSIHNYITIAMANIDTNFEALRGKESTDKLKGDTDSYFRANVTFGDLMEVGDIDSILFPVSDASDASHWVFSCSTKAIGGDKAAALAVVRSAVQSALPYGFVNTTDPAFTALLDYRWDRSSDRAMVAIGSITQDDGTTFNLYVHHFIANQ
jgi:hypothetical protein